MLRAAYGGPPEDTALILREGFDALAAVAWLDAASRTLATRTATLVPGNVTVRSRLGLDFVATHPFDQASHFDRVIESETTWRAEAGERSPFDTALTELADRYGRAPARTAAATLELPRAPLDRRWRAEHGPDRVPLELLLAPAALSVAGALLGRAGLAQVGARLSVKIAGVAPRAPTPRPASPLGPPPAPPPSIR